jgi:hypothetical protein
MKFNVEIVELANRKNKMSWPKCEYVPNIGDTIQFEGRGLVVKEKTFEIVKGKIKIIRLEL